MSLFQVLALITVACLFLLTVVAVWRAWITKRESMIWIVVWLVAATALVSPKMTSVLARAMGIGRGADLLLYCSVVVMMIGFLMIYVRLRRLRREMTLLVRHLAIHEAVTNDTPKNISPEKPGADDDSHA